MASYGKKVKVITYAEIIGLILVFIAVLVLLYPKKMLEKQLLAESSNYDLTETYLENMLRIEPSNRALMFQMAHMAYKRGKLDLALRLVNLLLKDASKTEKDSLYRLEYYILKQEYLYAKSSRQASIKPQLISLKNKIHSFDLSKESERKFWFDEMLWLKDYKRALDLSNKIVSMVPKNTYWLSQRYELAVRLGREDIMHRVLSELLLTDKDNHLYWLRQALKLAKDTKNLKEEAIYEAELDGVTLETSLIKKAKLALQSGLYLQASDSYMMLYEHTDNQEKRKEYLLKALDILLQGDLVQERIETIQSVEDDFLNDPEMMKYFLHTYLAADKLDLAVALSHKLLQKGKQP